MRIFGNRWVVNAETVSDKSFSNQDFNELRLGIAGPETQERGADEIERLGREIENLKTVIRLAYEDLEEGNNVAGAQRILQVALGKGKVS